MGTSASCDVGACQLQADSLWILGPSDRAVIHVVHQLERYFRKFIKRYISELIIIINIIISFVTAYAGIISYHRPSFTRLWWIIMLLLLISLL